MGETMEIIKFKNPEEYLMWLDHRSGAVKDKAAEFEKKFPGVVPLIIVADVDTCYNCSDGGVHIFLHPSLESVLDKIIS